MDVFGVNGARAQRQRGTEVVAALIAPYSSRNATQGSTKAKKSRGSCEARDFFKTT